jgi:hypothetical protein
MLWTARRSFLALASLLTIASSGCTLFSGESVATVRFFTTHAGTPDEMGYPNYGEMGTTRVFMTEDGWLISLSEVYVTTSEVHMIRCGEPKGTPIEMFWGPCAESYIATNDLESLPLGAITIEDGEFCQIEVAFGPYVPPPGGDEHVAVPNEAIHGKTFVVTGTARRGEGPTLEEYPFTIESEQLVRTALDVSKIDAGKPLRLEDEQFPRDLTIVKAYDHFFDGIDFASATPQDLEAAVLAAITNDAIVFDGTYD